MNFTERRYQATPSLAGHPPTASSLANRFQFPLSKPKAPPAASPALRTLLPDAALKLAGAKTFLVGAMLTLVRRSFHWSDVLSTYSSTMVGDDEPAQVAHNGPVNPDPFGQGLYAPSRRPKQVPNKSHHCQDCTQAVLLRAAYASASVSATRASTHNLASHTHVEGTQTSSQTPDTCMPWPRGCLRQPSAQTLTQPCVNPRPQPHLGAAGTTSAAFAGRTPRTPPPPAPSRCCPRASPRATRRRCCPLRSWLR